MVKTARVIQPSLLSLFGKISQQLTLDRWGSFANLVKRRGCCVASAISLRKEQYSSFLIYIKPDKLKSDKEEAADDLPLEPISFVRFHLCRSAPPFALHGDTRRSTVTVTLCGHGHCVHAVTEISVRLALPSFLPPSLAHCTSLPKVCAGVKLKRGSGKGGRMEGGREGEGNFPVSAP